MSNAIEDDWYERYEKLKTRLAKWEELGRYIDSCGLIGVREYQHIKREAKRLLGKKR